MKSPSNQIKRDIKSLLLTTILYLPVIFLWQNNTVPQKSIEKQKETIVNLNIFKQEPPTPPIIEETSPLEDDTLYDLDEIINEAIPEPIITPKPIIKEKILSKKTKPIVHKKIVKRVKKSKKLVQKRSHKKYKKKNISKTPKVSNKRFISTLKRKIEKNKNYPRMAKKRRLEGRVSVSFKVTKSGGVSNISIKGSKLFLKSARDAIKKSFPIDVKGIKVPISVKLTLNYKLRSR